VRGSYDPDASDRYVVYGQCLELVRKVWKSKDEGGVNGQQVDYELQFQDVREQLSLANAALDTKKNLVYINAASFIGSQFVAATPNFGEGKWPQLKSFLYDIGLKNKFWTAPLGVAYLESILTDLNTLNLNSLCKDCKFYGQKTAWTNGAAAVIVNNLIMPGETFVNNAAEDALLNVVRP